MPPGLSLGPPTRYVGEMMIPCQLSTFSEFICSAFQFQGHLAQSLELNYEVVVFWMTRICLNRWWNILEHSRIWHETFLNHVSNIDKTITVSLDLGPLKLLFESLAKQSWSKRNFTWNVLKTIMITWWYFYLGFVFSMTLKMFESMTK